MVNIEGQENRGTEEQKNSGIAEPENKRTEEPDNGRFDAFYALEADKRQRIIDAALKEFSEKGYKNASTNRIAANAQIGKGMLFYYFGNKEELYDFLCEYTLTFIEHEFMDKITCDSGDFIERQRLLAVAKRQAVRKEPLMFALFESIYRPENMKHAARFADTLTRYREEFMRKLYEWVDYSLFREDVAPERAIRYINWLLNGYTEEIMRKVKAGDLKVEADAAVSADGNEWARYDEFIEDLRKLFYKVNK